eukprot:gene5660-411_t
MGCVTVTLARRAEEGKAGAYVPFGVELDEGAPTLR